LRKSILLTALTLVVVSLMAAQSILMPTEAVGPGPPNLRFQGVLQPLGPKQFPVAVTGSLTGSLSAGFTGQLGMQARPTGHPPDPCFTGGIPATLQSPSSPTAPATDVILVIKATIPSGPSACPAGPFELDVQVFTGQTILTVNEPSGSVRWAGTVSLVMQVNTIGG